MVSNFESLTTQELEEIERRLILEYHSHLNEKARKWPPAWIERALEEIEKILKEKKKKKS